ncbi:MAG: metallophosphoesterase [Selenomonadaceae bacterium]|nr:metallophosphoesterase [Selenomonadaceae bacterium]
MNYRRILAIGDIHGRFDRLSSVFNKINFSSKDFLILLGDYVDRGNENLHCLQWAMRISKLPNVVALRGNHEQMMLYYYLLGGTQAAIWLPNGGDRTKAEIDKWCNEEELNRALRFINDRPLYHKMTVGDEDYIFVHAGLKPNKPLEEQDEESLLWIREEFYNGYRGSANIICGHTPTPFIERNRYYPIRLWNKITLLDTGSFMRDGKISCMDILSGTIWQSD